MLIKEIKSFMNEISERVYELMLSNNNIYRKYVCIFSRILIWREISGFEIEK